MSVSDGDNRQDQLLAEHDIRIRMLEANVSTLSQVSTELAQTSAAQTIHVDNLLEATRNNLTAIQCQGETIAKTVTDTAWIKRIGYAVIGAGVAVLTWLIQQHIGG